MSPETHADVPDAALDAPPEAPLDTAGRPITPSRLRRALQLNIAVGIGGSTWYAVCAPQAIFQVFFRNHLGGSDSQLGLLSAIPLLATPMSLLGILIYGHLRQRKLFWAITSALHRLYGFVLAGVAIHAARAGAGAQPGVGLIMASAAVSWALTTVCTSGWWAWMADLVPESIRASFFGRRDAIVRSVNMAWVFGVTVLLDAVTSEAILYAYAVVFALGGLVGVLDIVVHCFIPEPARHEDEPHMGWAEFSAPFRNRTFRFYSVTVGLWSLSMGVVSPFIWPYVTGPDIGAPQTWLGICVVLTGLAAIATSPGWGLVMDRFGRKPVILIGCTWVLMRILYMVMTPGTYTFLLPIMALGVGVLSPGYMTGVQQLMLTLTPERNRTAFVAWHSTTVGLLAAAGPILGGFLKDAVAGVRTDWGPLTLTSFHVVGATSLAMCALVFLLMLRVREGREKPVGFVVSRLVTPGLLRTLMNIGTMTYAATSERAASALRTLAGSSSDLALRDTIQRLDDPDGEVREEAARALGRIGSPDAVGALTERLRDPHATIRPAAARALGEVGDRRAVPALIDALDAPSEEVQEAAAQALGRIGGRDSVRQLLGLLREKRTERVRVSGAEAVSRHGIIEAAWEILPLMHETDNPVLRRQLAIALGNLMGRPGEFYRYLAGETTREGAKLGELFRGARRTAQALYRDADAGLRDPGGDAKAAARELVRLRGLVEGQSYRAALDGLTALMRHVTRAAIGPHLTDEVIVEYAFARDARLGLAWWFTDEVRRRMGRVSDPELLQIDCLLALYWLARYRLPEAGPRG